MKPETQNSPFLLLGQKIIRGLLQKDVILALKGLRGIVAVAEFVETRGGEEPEDCNVSSMCVQPRIGETKALRLEKIVIGETYPWPPQQRLASASCSTPSQVATALAQLDSAWTSLLSSA